MSRGNDAGDDKADRQDALGAYQKRRRKPEHKRWVKGPLPGSWHLRIRLIVLPDF